MFVFVSVFGEEQESEGKLKNWQISQLMELQGSKVLVDWLRPPAHIKVKPQQTMMTFSNTNTGTNTISNTNANKKQIQIKI